MGECDATRLHDDAISPLEPADDDEVRLTPHRRDMLIRLFAGQTPQEIARALGRSASTVTNTIATIRRRLGVRRDVDALREVLWRGIVTLEEIERRKHDLRLK
jgi:DNA-binding CsgD family transcriptional regulator